MKSLLAFTLLIVAFVAFSVQAFAASPTSTKEKPAVVQVVSTDWQQVSPIVVQTDIDLALAIPTGRLEIAGELAKAQRYERRYTTTPDNLFEDWISEVATPPNETAFNGFANVRPREQV